MAYRPQPGHSDADRNLLSNIHGRGIPTDQAVARIVALAQAMADQRRSGVEIKEAMASDQAQVFDNKTS
jgi:ethanolamine ammonia-lyase small subunit